MKLPFVRSEPELGSGIALTFKLARDQVERDISQYRVWFFSSACVATSVLNLVRGAMGKPHHWVGPVWLAFGALYAWIVRREVNRIGSRNVLVFLTLVLDMVVMTSVFVLIVLVDPSMLPLMAGPATTMAPLALMLILHLHGLRYYPQALIVGALLGWMLAAFEIVYFTGWHPQVGMSGVMFLLAGGIGLSATRQVRRDLETFGRLNLLRRFLPFTAVERVMRDHPDEALALGGESVTITILAADLRGFTAMSEKVFPAEIVRQLNAYHGVMLEVIERHGGVLDKFIGDGTLAIFGLNPTMVEQQKDCGAAAAVDCASSMISELEVHNANRAAMGQPPLKMGIGVHTGPVIAGNIGAPERRLEYTVIGDAVNTASRLEGLTKEAKTSVIVSADTVARLNDAARLHELPAMQVRGKEEAVRVFTF